MKIQEATKTGKMKEKSDIGTRRRVAPVTVKDPIHVPRRRTEKQRADKSEIARQKKTWSTPNQNLNDSVRLS